ncbi:hypothetical protein BDV09DRAFT_188729 [Aspergillus tetrazonus]
MAELVGVIASAITFGTVVAQLTRSINSLKDFCEQIRDLPSDISWLVQDIQVLGLVLGDIEAELVQEPIKSGLNNNKHVQQCLQFCVEAAAKLETTYKALMQDIQSGARILQYYAMTKLVMRRGRIEKHKSRLQDVIRLLLLSQQCYTRHYSTAGVGVGRKPPNSRSKAFVWRASLPPWVTTKALEISGLKFPDGWQWIFRTYNTIPLDSEVVNLTMYGDIQGLRRLFASEQASPFDRIEGNGYTLLHYAASGLNGHEVLEFLLNEGSDMSIAGNFSKPVTPLSYLVWSGSMGGGQGCTLLPSLQVLLRRSEEFYETPEETMDGFLADFHGTAEEFRFCQQRCCPNFYQMPQWTRVAVAATAASGFWDAYHMPETIRTILEESELGAEMLGQCGTETWHKSG